MQLVDDGVDVHRRPGASEVLERVHREVEAALHAGEEVLELLAARVDAHVEMREAGLDEALGDARLRELRAVRDHAHVEAARDRVARDVDDDRRERRLAAGQDDAEVAALGEVVDRALGRVEIEHPAGRRVGAEPAVLVAVTNELQVADVRHPGSVAALAES